jgi:hypothetical protein
VGGEGGVVEGSAESFVFFFFLLLLLLYLFVLAGWVSIVVFVFFRAGLDGFGSRGRATTPSRSVVRGFGLAAFGGHFIFYVRGAERGVGCCCELVVVFLDRM